MISINELAEKFENGLNEQLSDPNIRFRIWGSAGETEDVSRSGNEVTEFIYGTLVRTSSANDASTIEMGANTLVLDLFVPIKRPRVSANGTPLPRIVQGQYPFLDNIIQTVDEYFKLATTFGYPQNPTGDEPVYSIGLSAELTVTGTVDILPVIGNGVLISVNIDLWFVEGGLNARAVEIYIDGGGTAFSVPFQNVQFGSSNALISDVKSGEQRNKSFASATAVTFSATLPATVQAFTETLSEFIFEPVPNEVHFVSVTIAGNTRRYLMLIDSPNAAAQQVANIGLTVNFIEVTDDAEIMSIPSNYRIGRFTVASSSVTSLSFSVSGSPRPIFYIAGKVYSGTGYQTIQLSENDIVYDEEEDEYYVYLITVTGVSVTGGIDWV